MRSYNYQSAIHEAAYLFARYILFKNLNTIESVSIWRRKAHINLDLEECPKEFLKNKSKAYEVKTSFCCLAGKFADVFADKAEDEDTSEDWIEVKEAEKDIIEILKIYIEDESIYKYVDEITQKASDFVSNNFDIIQCVAGDLAKIFSGTLYRKDIEKILDRWIFEFRNIIYRPEIDV